MSSVQTVGSHAWEADLIHLLEAALIMCVLKTALILALITEQIMCAIEADLIMRELKNALIHVLELS